MTDPWIGRTYEGCRLDARIAASSSAHLYTATLLARDKPVSVALLHPGPNRRLPDPGQVLQVHWTVRNTPHQSVVLVHHACVVDGQLLLVMDELRGETLQQAVRRGPLAPHAVVQLAHELASAVDHLHRLDVVHGYIAPTRVLLTSSGARLLELGAADPTKQKTKAVDIVTIGYCLYIAATGRAATRNMPPAATVAPNLPSWLSTLIDDCRSRSASRRPVDGTALLERIRRESEPLLARSGPSPTNAQQAPLSSTPFPASPPAVAPANGAPLGSAASDAATPSVTVPSLPDTRPPSVPSPADAFPAVEETRPSVAPPPDPAAEPSLDTPPPAVSPVHHAPPPPVGPPPPLFAPPPASSVAPAPVALTAPAPATDATQSTGEATAPEATEPLPDFEPTALVEGLSDDSLTATAAEPPPLVDLPAPPSSTSDDVEDASAAAPVVSAGVTAEPEPPVVPAPRAAVEPATATKPEPVPALVPSGAPPTDKPDSTESAPEKPVPVPPSRVGPHPVLIVAALAFVVVLGVSGIFVGAWYFSTQSDDPPTGLSTNAPTTAPAAAVVEAEEEAPFQNDPDPDQTARLTITNQGGRPVHLSCSWSVFGSGSDTGESGIEEALLNNESFSRDEVPLETRCNALEPSSGTALWSWTADAPPDDEDGWSVTIPTLSPAPAAPASSSGRTARRADRRSSDRYEPPAASTDAPARSSRPSLPPPPEFDEIPSAATLQIVPSSKRKRRREGIEVRVDGMKRGIAPVTLSEFPLGTHRIDASWEGVTVSCAVKLKASGVTVGVDPAGQECARK